mmetsp:Transcript_34952/g.84568  ORF Transcript_34952/g.84568 Transcript_34952/m.84568 type:complete len:88 (+) Transcript_34952:1077-1340(+)
MWSTVIPTNTAVVEFLAKRISKHSALTIFAKKSGAEQRVDHPTTSRCQSNATNPSSAVHAAHLLDAIRSTGFCLDTAGVANETHIWN